MKRCSLCIIPDTASGIAFDENGLCQLCKDFKKVKPKGEDELKSEIKSHISSECENNCIVPVSGGRDSSYALYYVKSILGLNPIAVHSDNDFETEIARTNLENITKNLDVPLVIVGSKKNTLKKIVSEKFKMNAPYGPGLMVDQACEACKYGFESAAYNLAKKKKIKLIFWGDSAEESTASYHALNEHKTPTKWERLLSSGALNYVKYKYYFEKLKREYGPDSPDQVKEIHLYDFIEWDRNVIVDTIQGKLGWMKPDESTTSWRIDCTLVPIINYLTTKAWGVSKIELGFSSMIRSGKMDRDDAIRKVEKINEAISTDELNNFLKELNISEGLTRKIL